MYRRNQMKAALIKLGRKLLRALLLKALMKKLSRK